jgi:FMN-dependent NADH-azoreductase
MTTLLHVIASPQASTSSFSGKVADAFIKAYQETHPTHVIDTLDLWNEPLPALGALSASWKTKVMMGQPPTADEDAERAILQTTVDRFMAADRYVFSVPMWNFSVPYRLKHYIDVIVQPGMTFGFDPAKGYFGLVPGQRPVYVVQSRGGSYAAGTPMASMDFQAPYLDLILGFIGLTNVTTQLVECTALGPQVSDPIVAQAIRDAMRAGATF